MKIWSDSNHSERRSCSRSRSGRSYNRDGEKHPTWGTAQTKRSGGSVEGVISSCCTVSGTTKTE